VIIAATRITTSSGAEAVAAHVFAGTANESIEVLQGCPADLEDMVRDAEAHGAKYAIRHYAISPAEEMTRAEAIRVVQALAHEFGFDLARVVLIEHEKRRQGDGGYERHWHALVPEVDPVHGRVLDSHWMRPRQEKISRTAEVRLGHRVVTGRWNAAVEKALRKGDLHDVADRVVTLGKADRPRAAYSSDSHQLAQRRGVSLPEARQAVAEVWRAADSASAFAVALQESGLTLRQGDKAGIWVIEAVGSDGEPVTVGAVDRLVREKRAHVAARLGELTKFRQLDGAAEEITSAEDVQRSPPFTTGDSAKIGVSPAINDAGVGYEPPALKVKGDWSFLEGGEVCASPAQSANNAPAETQHSVAASDPAAEITGTPAAEGEATPAQERSGAVSVSPSGDSLESRSVEHGHGVSSPADDYVAPLDPSKPGDIARFFREWGAKERKRIQRAAIEEAARRRSASSPAFVGQGGYDEHEIDQWLTAAWLKDARRDFARTQVEYWRRHFGDERARDCAAAVRKLAAEQRAASGKAPIVVDSGSRRDPGRSSGSGVDYPARSQGFHGNDLRRPRGGAGERRDPRVGEAARVGQRGSLEVGRDTRGAARPARYPRLVRDRHAR
jgi:hypothetical protein